MIRLCWFIWQGDIGALAYVAMEILQYSRFPSCWPVVKNLNPLFTRKDLKNDSQISRQQRNESLSGLRKCFSWGIICGCFLLIVVYFKSHDFDWHDLHSSFAQELLVQVV